MNLFFLAHHQHHRQTDMRKNKARHSVIIRIQILILMSAHITMACFLSLSLHLAFLICIQFQADDLRSVLHHNLAVRT